MLRFKNKNAQMNQIFIYLVSIIIIVFVGFLVIRFVGTFLGDVEDRGNSKIYDDFSKSFDRVYETYGAEKSLRYRLSENTKYICFAEESDCVADLSMLSDVEKSSFQSTVDAGDHVAVFDAEGIVNSGNIGNFSISENNGCLCIEPSESGYFTVILENRKNVVWIWEE